MEKLQPPHLNLLENRTELVLSSKGILSKAVGQHGNITFFIQ